MVASVKREKRPKTRPKAAFKVGDRVYSITDEQQDLTILEIKDGVATCKPPHRTQIACKLEHLRHWKFRFAVDDWFRVGDGKTLHYVAEINHEEALIGWIPHPCCDGIDWIPETSNLHLASAPDWADLRQTDRVALICPNQSTRLGEIQKIDYSSLMAEMKWDEGDAEPADLTRLYQWDYEWKLGDRIIQDGNKPDWAPKDRMAALVSHGTIVDIRLYCGKLTPWVRWSTGVEAGEESWGIVSEFHRWDEGVSEPAPLPPLEPPMTAEQTIAEMEQAMQGQPETKIASDNNPSAIIENPAKSITSATSSPFAEAYEAEGRSITLLSNLSNQINEAHQQCEQALTVARSAEQSALEHAKRCGELLLQAKAEVGHGGWEQWRQENVGIPSSTASLYQRVAKRWEELASAGAEGLTLREADRLLRKAPNDNKERLDRHTAQVEAILGSSTTDTETSTPPPHKPVTVATGDAITNAEGSIRGTAVATKGDRVTIEWANGRTSDYTHKEIAAYGYQRVADVTSPPSPPKEHIWGLSEIHYAVRKFAALNDRDWDEQMCDEVAAAVLDFLAEY